MSPPVIPVAALAVVSGAVATVSFKDTVSIGGVVITFIVAVGTVVTLVYGARLRAVNRILEAERDVYEKKTVRLEDDLKELEDDREVYREQKHVQINELTGDLATTRAELVAEKQKHDYTGMTDRFAAVEEELHSRTALFEKILSAQDETTRLVAKVMEAQSAQTGALSSISNTMDALARRLEQAIDEGIGRQV